MQELTKDFKILPSKEYVKNLIKKDSEDIAAKIQERVVNQIEDLRGSVTVTEEIPDLYYKNVVKIIKKWTKLYDYNLKVDGCNFTVFDKSYQSFKKKNCEMCKKRKRMNLYNIMKYASAGFTLACILIVNILVYINAQSPYLGMLFVNCVGSIIGVITYAITSGIYKNSKE